jgi:hypothetical protein
MPSQLNLVLISHGNGQCRTIGMTGSVFPGQAMHHGNNAPAVYNRHRCFPEVRAQAQLTRGENEIKKYVNRRRRRRQA